MPSKKDEASFAAFLEPSGICLVEYRRERDGIQIIRRHSDASRLPGLADAGERVAELITKMGVQQSRLSVAVRGFGSTYQIMMLPPAEPAILGPVVRRELARLNPDMPSPRVDYVLGGQFDRRRRERPEGGTPQREVLVGAAPEIAVSAFGEELALAGIELDHLTLLPQVLQRLYESGNASRDPEALFIDLPGGPVIGFFHESQLRLVVEPPVTGDDDLSTRAQVISEHVDRGNLFLRQQFRGVELSRLLIAVKEEESAAFLDSLGEQLNLPVETFPGPVSDPGVLACIGTVLDAEAEKGLNLSPFAESPEDKKERARRRLVTLTAIAVSAVAVLWAFFTVAATLRLSSTVEESRKVAVERMSQLAPLRIVAAERQKNAQSRTYLRRVRAGDVQIQGFIRALLRATPPGIQLTNLGLQRSGDEWSVTLTGSGYGETGADVLLAIDRFFHAIPREMTVHDLVLTDLNDAPASQFGAAMRFTMTFVLSAPAEPRQ